MSAADEKQNGGNRPLLPVMPCAVIPAGGKGTRLKPFAAFQEPCRWLDSGRPAEYAGAQRACETNALDYFTRDSEPS